MKELNEQLLKQIDDLQRKLQSTDPEILKEQKEIIDDLKKKVAILERELQLVHENFEQEVEQYKLNGGYRKKGANEELEEVTM